MNNKKETRAYIITDEGIKQMITKDVNNNKRQVVKDNNRDDK